MNKQNTNEQDLTDEQRFMIRNFMDIQAPSEFEQFLNREAHGDNRKAEAWFQAQYCSLMKKGANSRGKRSVCSII
ncbi:hypothetical protein A2335_00225 [Candidatus Peregrinibacteria bacterium RIFOXYB2_FULL_32_7]|nr:MAG: hypothetical protein A2335_00225 [Candidatus Peregrinibacteria bacterium RIFOXYB2_FULL_32_7]